MTVGALCRRQFEAIAEGLRLPSAGREGIRAFLDRLLPRLGIDDRRIEDPPRWSAIGDDASPFEWSIVPGASPELRLLVEAQADPAHPRSYWAAASALTEWCVDRLHADTSRLERVLDLYEPRDPRAYFACWHGFEFTDIASAASSTPRVKIYLNAWARGRDHARAVVDRTFERLGYESARAVLTGAAAAFHPVHVSLDLRGDRSARLKLYLRVFDVAQLKDLYRFAGGGDPDDIADLSRALELPARWPRPGFCVLHFAGPQELRPARAVANLPIRDVVGDDRRVTQLLTRWLARLDIDAAGYLATLAHLDRADDRDRRRLVMSGRHSYLSFQRDGGRPRVTIYFGARVFADRLGWIAMDPAQVWPTPTR